MKPFTRRFLVPLCLALLLGGCKEILGPSSEGPATGGPKGDATAIFGEPPKYQVRNSGYANGLLAAIFEQGGALTYQLFDRDGQVAFERPVAPNEIEEDEFSFSVATLLGVGYVFEKYNPEPIATPFLFGRAADLGKLSVLLSRVEPGDQIIADLIFHGETQDYHSVEPLPVIAQNGEYEISTLEIYAKKIPGYVNFRGTVTTYHIPDLPGGSVDASGMSARSYTNP